MDRVAEGIEDGGDLFGNSGVVAPDVGHGQRDEFGKGAGAIHANAGSVCTEMAAAGEAVAAASAGDVTFAGDEVADFEVGDVGADGGDFADEFVADDHGHRNGLLSPFVPLVDVDVGAADAGTADADKNIVDAVIGLRNIFEPEASFGCEP